MGALSSDIMDVLSASGNASIYACRFNWMTPILGAEFYSPHTIEFPVVFDNATTAAGVIMTGGSEQGTTLAATVSEAWVNFGKTGKTAAPGLPEWPKFSPKDCATMHLDTASRVDPYMDSDIVERFQTILWKRAGAE